jgi:hypothetical protein
MSAFVKMARVGVMAGCMALPTALSAMPNPGETKPYTDHSKAIGLGAEYASQHYGSVMISPAGKDSFAISLTCENGEDGASTNALFRVDFLREGEVVGSYERECHLTRGFPFSSHQKETNPGNAYIPGGVEQITHIRFLAFKIGRQ